MEPTPQDHRLEDLRARLDADERHLAGLAERENEVRRAVNSERSARAALEARLAAVEEQVSSHGKQLAGFAVDAAETDRKAEIVDAASKGWRVAFEARGDLVLRSDSGDVAKLPIAVARLLVEGKPVDLGVDVSDPENVSLVDGQGRIVAKLPRTLIVTLDRALEGWDSLLKRSLSLGSVSKRLEVRPEGKNAP